MKTFLLIFTLLGTEVQKTLTATHSLKYFYTASQGVPSFPEFVTVGLVNEQQISYYDSIQRKEVPKQDWIFKAEEPEYWDKQTMISIKTQQRFKMSIETVKQRLNKTQGPHIVQNMYGCEWNDETEAVRGFNQFGYNGEDYIAFNLETQTWIAPKQQAVITKMKWDRDLEKINSDKEYLTHVCVRWLKTYIEAGKNSLMRKELPEISLLQKSSSSPVTCHATGFYPAAAMLSWKKDGEEVTEGVDPGEILPNGDGTFQLSSELHVKSIPSADWGRYSCVFELSGVEEPIITKLDRHGIRSNVTERKTCTTIVISVACTLLLFGVVILSAFLFLLKIRNSEKKAPPYSEVKN